MADANRPIGIVAGGGRLPIAAARGIHAAGHRVACIGLHDQYDRSLPEHVDTFKQAGLIQIGRWVRIFRHWGVRRMMLLGKVEKVKMYDPFYLFRHRPDWRAAKIWFGRARHDRRPDQLLTALADTLASEGIQVIDSTQYIPDQMAEAGVMTRTQPTADQMADVDFALPIIRRLGDLDIGQSIAVKSRDVIAVEAIEGTDRMIERTGQLCRRGNWTLVKVAKPHQDMRFDVPTVGLRTIQKMAEQGGRCLAVEAGRTILLDKPQFLQAADTAGIAVVGVEMGTDAGDKDSTWPDARA